MKRILFISILIVSLIVALPFVFADSGNGRPVISPDLKMLQLQGPVKSVVLADDGGAVAFELDRHGNIDSFYVTQEEYRVIRNEKGQVVEWLEWRTWWTKPEPYARARFYYNDEGYIYKGSETRNGDWNELTFVLNEHGWPVSATEESITVKKEHEAASHYKGTRSYSYTDIDKHGNWLRCEGKKKGRYNNGNPCEHKFVYTRKITYWE